MVSLQTPGRVVWRGGDKGEVSFVFVAQVGGFWAVAIGGLEKEHSPREP